MSAKTNAKKKEQDKPQSSGLGLDGLGDLAGLLNEQPAANAGGAGPQELPLDLIDEDPHQPRTADNPGFSPESIAEIGETIKARGVKSPISVRENPDAPGRYLINHGARRYRGSKWAHKTTIPAFIDNDYNEADQVIENLQRNELRRVRSPTSSAASWRRARRSRRSPRRSASRRPSSRSTSRCWTCPNPLPRRSIAAGART